VFEVDHPETGAWKQACVRRMLGRLRDPVRYVPLHFGGGTWPKRLQRRALIRRSGRSSSGKG
jgi:O-methyltransferase involved in polyketide biosynthesis